MILPRGAPQKAAAPMKRHWSSRSACAAVIFLSVLACVSPRTVSARIDPAIGDRIVELTTESDVRGLLATPSRWIDNNNRDGRSMTTTLLVLHKSGSLFAGATSASDSHEAGSNGSRAAVSTSHSSGQDLRPFLNALSEAMEQMRPLRKGSPFVEVSFLDSQAAPAAARALGQHVVSQQVIDKLVGDCVIVFQCVQIPFDPIGSFALHCVDVTACVLIQSTAAPSGRCLCRVCYPWDKYLSVCGRQDLRRLPRLRRAPLVLVQLRQRCSLS